jgi:glutaredoxin-related protein
MEDVLKLIAKQVKENPIMLYMKGTPAQPMCGFSSQVVRILHAVGTHSLAGSDSRSLILMQARTLAA